MTPGKRRRDPTFLRLAAIAGLGGVGAIATSVVVTLRSMHGGHPTSTYFFFSLWGIAALAGAAANIATYYQSGDPPGRPPRGGKRLAAPISLDARRPTAVTDPGRRKAA
jgi:hypothetical protein